ncbi:hypothetical protein Pst134EA_004966 [Puccinia striiformis f. sp. tritici]|uniref:hypothetical protein n=1 Tax=Puccinia striiformis f. sp. tritici TaxID=168172 RepID=UPI0020073999|nr:hypothetical protein Pst134EA_004966 [Puccinia striiformis f. sp. tritici]KAH9471057.1 hypothetical protein Pst134EA_004966 [Puccinia striiformis f. sp. tritici]
MTEASVPVTRECHLALPISAIKSKNSTPNPIALIISKSATMCIMNMFQRAYTTFALLALFVTFHPGQVEAVEITTKECSYHFNRVGSAEGRASCQYNDFVDFSCDPNSCLTQQDHAFENVYFYGCHVPGSIVTRPSVHAAQYYRRDTYASVQDWDGSWWDCDFNVPQSNNNQYLSKSRLSRN